jgi:phosphoribosylanthranilate isomerase
VSVSVKICGLRNPDSVRAATEGGASFAGFVFHPPSPRAITAAQAAALSEGVPATVKKVGLFVDPADDDLAAVLDAFNPDLLQLHGDEPPQRVAQIRAMTGLPVMKAVRIAGSEDFRLVPDYEAAADLLLFDAKTGPLSTGGTGTSFDWSLLQDRNFTKPWMLAGGLNAGNLAEAVAATGARIVDVSSGVEDAPGRKNPAKIRAFLALAATL